MLIETSPFDIRLLKRVFVDDIDLRKGVLAIIIIIRHAVRRASEIVAFLIVTVILELC